MKKTTSRLVVCGTLVVLVLGIIWGNSCMTGESSGRFSAWVGAILSKILPFFSPESEIGHFILRKIGHFSEFAALGLLLSWLYGMLAQRKWLMLGLPFISGVAAAAIDETIQIFTPGRHSSIVDVGIDSSGVLAGIAFLHLCWLILRKIQQRKMRIGHL